MSADGGRTRGEFVELLLVVLQREPQLLDRLVGGRKRVGAVSAEIMTRVLKVILGALERLDRFPNFWMGLTASAFLGRGRCLLLNGHNLIGRDG